MESLLRHHTPTSTIPLMPTSPRFQSPKTMPHRSRRGSRAHKPEPTPDKENLTSTQMASTSAKTLDMVSHMITSSPSPRKSPFSGVTKRSRASSAVSIDQADALSSSDESDDTAVVFFGQPTSAEKKRRVRYEQRVIEKRLKHKDSLDLTRQRPISFNPDDTMLMEESTSLQHGWSLDGPTPAAAKPAMIPQLRQRSSPLKNSQLVSSPVRSSPPKSALHPPAEDFAATDAQALHTINEKGFASVSTPGVARNVVAPALHSTTNPFHDWSSPRKISYVSPQKFSSPVRSVETLIDATLGQQQVPRSGRRSPRLSLRRLQQSTSPVRCLNPSIQQSNTTITPFARSTSSVPPFSTGLSGFACLRIVSVSAASNGDAAPIQEEQPSPSMHAAARGEQFREGLSSLMRATQPSPQAHQYRMVSPTRPGRSMFPAAATPTSKQVLNTHIAANTLDRALGQDSDAVLTRTVHQPPVTPATDCTLVRAVAVDEQVSPGPVFRQTARRVPIQQHEAEFGVKLSPDKRGSPYKSQGKSSALRTQEPATKIDRIPARRVQMHVVHPATDPIVPTKASDDTVRRAPSVASKAARAGGPFVNRLGSRGASSTLPPAVLSRAVSAPASAPVLNTKPPVRTQSVASKPTVVGRAASSSLSPKRPSSGLPRPALSGNSRLPRPATAQPTQLGARHASQSRPVPMAIARLPPSAQASAVKSAQQSLNPTSSGAEASVLALTQSDRNAHVPKHQSVPSSPLNPSPNQHIAPPAGSKNVPSLLRPTPARIASPARQVPVKVMSPVRKAPAVVRDPEQQRLRCLAMQERARNRPQRSASSSNTPSSGSSEMESPMETQSSPIRAVDSPDVGSDPTTEASSSPVKPDVGAGTATGPRSLRASRTVRNLTPSAQRVPAARGRTLSLNDIIAARKVDVPLTLTDQLRLADTVNKKQNEKILAKYKITKVHHPYERPPSPDQHVHEPEACIIVDDQGNHRKGKGDLSTYSTPPRARHGSSKSVKWYRPLFVDRGSHYGNKLHTARPALKPVGYSLDKLGNKLATGASPKLTVGQPVVIFRNFFKGEAVPDDA